MTTYYITILLVALMACIAQYGSVNIRTATKIIEKKETKLYKFFVFFSAAILIFVAGLRYQVGTDYNSYARGYENTVDGLWQHIITFDEPGINIIAWLGSLIYDDFATMFFLASLITIGLNVKTIEKCSSDFMVAMLLYVFIGAWHGSFNGVRQYLAAAVLFFGHRYMHDRKFGKYLVVVLIAMCFHRTALIMLPVYFIAGKKITMKNVIIIISAAIIMRYSYDFLFDIMSSFKGTDQSEYEYMQTEVNAMRILVAFAPLILATIIPKKFREDTETAFYINMLIVNAALMFATANSAYLARVGIYTDVYVTIALPKIIKGFTRRSQKLLEILIIGLYATFWIYEISARSSLSTFQWIFNR